jgi:hypothetical protein
MHRQKLHQANYDHQPTRVSRRTVTMRSFVTAGLAVLLLFPTLAIAQTARTPQTPAADPALVARAAQEAAEDLTLTRVLVGLRLTPAQLADLLPLLQDAQRRLQALDQENAESIARHKGALEEERKQLLAAKSASPRVQTKYLETLALAETKRTKLRTDLTGALKRSLAKYLGTQQEALLIQVARSVSFQERTAGFRLQAMSGERGGGPINFMGQMMDRIRQMSPEEFQRQQGRIGGRFGGGANPEQTAAMMAQIRAMSPEAYAQQRADLALRLFDQNANRRDNNANADPQAEIDRFIDRYFLSPRIAVVVGQRLGRR